MSLNTFLPVLLCMGFTIQLLRALAVARRHREVLSSRDIQLCHDQVKRIITLFGMKLTSAWMAEHIMIFYILQLVSEQLGIPYRLPDSGCPGYNEKFQFIMI